MAEINTEAVLQALDDGLNPSDISNAMINQGIDPLEANSALKSILEQKELKFEPITMEQLTEPVEPIEIPEPPRPFISPEEIFEPIETEENKERIFKELENPQSELFKGMTPVQVKFLTTFVLEDPLDSNELAARLKNINIKYEPIKRGKAFFGDVPSRIEMAHDSAVVSHNIMLSMQEQGFDMRKILNPGTEKEQIIGPDDPLFSQPIPNAELVFVDPSDPSGKTLTFLTPNIWQDMRAAEAEIIGAISGAIALGPKIAKFIPVATPITAIGKAAVLGAGILIGGATGAATGRAADAITNSLALKEEIDFLRVSSQMVDAGFTDVLFTVGGVGILKGGSIVIKGTFNTAKAAGGRFQTTRALKTMRESMNITKTQQDEIIQTYMKLNDLTKISADDTLRILATTTKEGAQIARTTAVNNIRAANVISESAKTRATELLELSNKSTDPNEISGIIKGMIEFNADVHSVYAAQKLAANDLTQLGKITFDYGRSIIGPLKRDLSKEIQNPTKRRAVLNFIEQIGKTSKDRSFKAMLDTRTVISDFLRSSPKLDIPQKNALKQSLKLLDGKIALLVKQSSDDKAQFWFEGYRKSLQNRDEMFELQKNVLFNTLTKGKANIDDQINAFVEFFRAESGIYNDIVERLPVFRDKVETAVANSLIERFTVVEAGEVIAIKFTELAEEMAKYDFRFVEAKKIKLLVNEMAKVYQIDPVLARTSAGLQGDISSGIGKDLGGRLHVALSSNAFQRFFSFLPTRRAKEITLANRLLKVLENPLDNKSVKELMEILEPDIKSSTIINLSDYIGTSTGKSLQEFQIQTIKEGGPRKLDIPKKTIFSTTLPGKEEVEKIGKLGSGIPYKDSRKAATKELTSETQRVRSRQVHDYRIAKDSLLAILLGKTVTAAGLKEQEFNIREELLKKGYLGYQFGDDVILYK